mmetsp:Transcript_8863/g.17172  ORF Transcript_8863/g.17172 Transcript_8863/m.17172 type:complete len:136 (+) Transcript_8863:268-675(+)
MWITASSARRLPAKLLSNRTALKPIDHYQIKDIRCKSSTRLKTSSTLQPFDYSRYFKADKTFLVTNSPPAERKSPEIPSTFRHKMLQTKSVLRTRETKSIEVKEYDSSIIPSNNKRLSMEDVGRYVTYNTRLPFK